MLVICFNVYITECVSVIWQYTNRHWHREPLSDITSAKHTGLPYLMCMCVRMCRRMYLCLCVCVRAHVYAYAHVCGCVAFQPITTNLILSTPFICTVLQWTESVEIPQPKAVSIRSATPVLTTVTLTVLTSAISPL